MVRLDKFMFSQGGSEIMITDHWVQWSGQYQLLNRSGSKATEGYREKRGKKIRQANRRRQKGHSSVATRGNAV